MRWPCKRPARSGSPRPPAADNGGRRDTRARARAFTGLPGPAPPLDRPDTPRHPAPRAAGCWFLSCPSAALASHGRQSHSQLDTLCGRHGRAAVQITDLGEVTDADSDAAALNNAGQVAGTARDTGETSQGFAWNERAGVPLGALPKHHFSIAYGINAAGQIAAASYNIPGHGRAFLWNGSPHRHRLPARFPLQRGARGQ